MLKLKVHKTKSNIKFNQTRTKIHFCIVHWMLERKTIKHIIKPWDRRDTGLGWAILFWNTILQKGKSSQSVRAYLNKIIPGVNILSKR